MTSSPCSIFPCAIEGISQTYVLQEHSYNVYFLQSEISNKTYVGYTKFPSQRILQHNGIIKGPVTKRTMNGRPYKYVFIITGFKTPSEACQFEYRWHKLRSSRIRIKDGPNGKRRYKKGENMKGYLEPLKYLFSNKWTASSPEPFSYPLTIIWNDATCEGSFEWNIVNPSKFASWNVYQGRVNLNDIPKAITLFKSSKK